MLVNIITNSKRIVNFIKKSEGFGGVCDKQPKAYVMLNIPIGYVDRFSESIDAHIESRGVNLEKYGYRILNLRGHNVIEKGTLK